MSGLFETLSGAKGLRAQGKSEQNIDEFNAQVAEQEAIAAKSKAAFAQKRQAKRGVAIQSALEAKLGEAGGIGSLVAGDLAGEQAEELELENLLLGFEGEVLAGRAESQAELDRLQGRLAKQRGKSAARAANIKFGTQLAFIAATAGAGGGGSGSAGAGAGGSQFATGALSPGGLGLASGKRLLTGF